MKKESLFEKAKCKLKLFEMSLKYDDNFKFKDVAMDKIPELYTKFGGSNDKWVALEFPEVDDISGAIYIGEAGGVFPPHRHSSSSEHIVILNQGGKIEVISSKGSEIIEFPNAYLFEKNLIHAVKFLTETKLFIAWHPRFKTGWQSDILDVD